MNTRLTAQKIESLIDQITSLSETAQTGIYLREGVKAIIIGEIFFLLFNIA